MHSNCLFIVPAEDKSDATSQVESFLEDYYQQVYDWYVIGGRFEDVIPGAVAPLSECLEKVKEYSGYHNTNTIDAYNSMQKYLQKDSNQDELTQMGNLQMAGDYAIERGKLICDYFFISCCLYDIEYGGADHIPKDPTGYYVVSVDMHN